MKIDILRYSAGNESTLGLFIIDGHVICYSLEDEKRTVKKYGETRIPAGRYEIKLRIEGRTHKRYLKKFPEIHKGMLYLQDVPGFEYILIHIGNTDKDTAGCILVGDQVQMNLSERGKLFNSTIAYKKIYSMIAYELEQGKMVFIEIKDLNKH